MNELMRPVFPGTNRKPISNRNVVDVTENAQAFGSLFGKILGGVSDGSTLAGGQRPKEAVAGEAIRNKVEKRMEPKKDDENLEEVTPVFLAEVLAANVGKPTNLKHLEVTMDVESSGDENVGIPHVSPGMIRNHNVNEISAEKSAGYISETNQFTVDPKTIASTTLTSQTEGILAGAFDELVYEAQDGKQMLGGERDPIQTAEQSQSETETPGKPVQTVGLDQHSGEELLRMMQGSSLAEGTIQSINNKVQTNDGLFINKQVVTSPNEMVEVSADEKLQLNAGTTDIKDNTLFNDTKVSIELSDSQSNALESALTMVDFRSLETTGSKQEQVVPKELLNPESVKVKLGLGQEQKNSGADLNATADDEETQVESKTIVAAKVENPVTKRETGEYLPGKKSSKDQGFTKLTGLGHEWSSLNSPTTMAKALTSSQPLIQEHTVVPREVVEQIVQGAHVMVRDGAVQMQIRLEPAELGKVELKITCERDIVTAHFVAENEAVKQIIESNLSQLKSTLQQNGVHAENFSVSVGSNSLAQNGGQFGRHNAFNQPQQSKAYNQEWLNEQEMMDQTGYNSYWTGRVNLMA